MSHKTGRDVNSEDEANPGAPNHALKGPGRRLQLLELHNRGSPGGKHSREGVVLVQTRSSQWQPGAECEQPDGQSRTSAGWGLCWGLCRQHVCTAWLSGAHWESHTWSRREVGKHLCTSVPHPRRRTTPGGGDTPSHRPATRAGFPTQFGFPPVVKAIALFLLKVFEFGQ